MRLRLTNLEIVQRFMAGLGVREIAGRLLGTNPEQRVERAIRRWLRTGRWMPSGRRFKRRRAKMEQGPWSQYRDDELCALAEGWAYVEEMTPEERQRQKGSYPIGNGPLKDPSKRAELLRELVGRLKRERSGPRAGGL